MSNKTPVSSSSVIFSLNPIHLALSFLLLILISFSFYSLARDLATSLEEDLRNAFDQQNLTVVDIASSRVGFHIANDVAENVRLLGQFPAMQRLELYNGTRDMEKVNTFAAPRVDGFVLFKANGDFFTSYPKSMHHLYKDNQANTPFFKQAKDTASLYFSDWIHADGHLRMQVSNPLFNIIIDKNFPEPDNKFAGVIMAQIDFDRTIATELGRLKSSGMMHWIVDEATGEVLYHSVLPRAPSKHATDSHTSTLAKALLKAFRSTVLEPGVHRTKINGKGYSIAAARSQVGPHKIIVNLAYDNSTVTSLVHEKTNRIYMLGIAFLAVIIIGFFITLKQTAKRQILLGEKEHLSRELSLEEEKKKLREQVFQLQKMESIGELAAGTAHELNNALSGPMGILSILRIQPDMDIDKRSVMLDKAIIGMDQSRKIVDGLLRFSRNERNEKHIASLNDDITFVLDMYKNELDHEGITLKQSLAPDLPECLASHRQVQQVLLNLIGNARYALKKGGILEIISQSESRQGKHGCLISIKDNGAGIDKEVIQRIFEPFYSTKPTGQGTGLGLSICYGIIQDHGGNLDVHSELGKGATFSIWLPTSEESTS
ncbi:MAG: ATP-binding protein [Mariprofundaceae bacterium]